MKVHADEVKDEPDLKIIEPLCAVFRRTLKAEGLKYTPERAQVLDAALRFEGLFEAEQVIDLLKGSGFRVSKATVYRTIKLLVQAGIVQRVPFDDEQAHYQTVFGRQDHVLVIRTDTGQAVPVEMPELVRLRDEVCRRLGLVAKGHRLHIFAAGEPTRPG
ncbi:MAG: transcriptional repressor [Phycisphaerales bacterium]|jgi:Fur family ferric uptake transcriptional regulator